jgi:hypothetical protein
MGKQSRDGHDARAVLLEAAAIVERGWCQFQSGHRRKDGARCATGAIDDAAGGDINLSVDAFEALCRVIDGTHIATWNDAPERTKADVIAALHRAADLALEVH